MSMTERSVHVRDQRPRPLAAITIVIAVSAVAFGGGSAAAVLAVVSQALIFGSVHFQWGLGGIVMTSAMGLIWGAAYLLCGRNLWIVILAHSAAHIALILSLYSAPVSTQIG